MAKTHYPDKRGNKHTMNVHIATKLIRSVITMLACALPHVPRRLGRQGASRMALLSKEERPERRKARYRLDDAKCGVERFLENCEARRSQQRPPPNRISWRTGLNGMIVSPT